MKHNFKELMIWKNGIELVKEIYSVTKNMPNDERFGLVLQMNRSVISIPSNIAKGSGKTSIKEFANYLNHSISSFFELETQLVIAYQLGFVKYKSLEKITQLLHENQRMILGFKSRLTSSKIYSTTKSKV